jgi:hypothetical protein
MRPQPGGIALRPLSPFRSDCSRVGGLGHGVPRTEHQRAGPRNCPKVPHPWRRRGSNATAELAQPWRPVFVRARPMARSAPRRDRCHATNFQSSSHILAIMRIRSDRSRTIMTSKARRPHDLLDIWLDLLKTFDDAPRRRAAKVRRAQRARRSIPMRPLPSSGGPSSKSSLPDRRSTSI